MERVSEGYYFRLPGTGIKSPSERLALLPFFVFAAAVMGRFWVCKLPCALYSVRKFVPFQRWWFLGIESVDWMAHAVVAGNVVCVCFKRVQIRREFKRCLPPRLRKRNLLAKQIFYISFLFVESPIQEFYKRLRQYLTIYLVVYENKQIQNISVLMYEFTH